MIIRNVQNYSRPDDYDGYEDYYVNPDFRPRRKRTLTKAHHDDEDDDGMGKEYTEL